MRLLDTQTLELRSFNSGAVPTYAILSHTWEDEEVTLQQFHTRDGQRKKGYKKILDFCDEAAAEGYQWCWVDTCCIDKTNLVELSQAINSMFAWYRDAAVCFAYLSDFYAESNVEHERNNRLEQSRWFTRGWTLQELIAPEYVVFYDARWRLYGTKSEIAMALAKITGISPRLLRGDKSLHEYSTAQKMSWAAYRQTTRVEDRAYSLLGIFNIYFPLAYGEGWNAFARLQAEILKTSTDQSIFAWVQRGPVKPAETLDVYRAKAWDQRHRCSMLAPTPDCFYGSSSVICASKDRDADHAHPLLARHISGANNSIVTQALNKPIALNNTGMQITLLVQRIFAKGGRCLLEAMLNCCYDFDKQQKVTIFLVADNMGINEVFAKERQDSVAACRVEPYHLGSATWQWHECSRGPCRQEWQRGQSSSGELWVATPLDIHPIYPEWPEFPRDERVLGTAWIRDDELQADEARRRVARARELRQKPARDVLAMYSTHRISKVLSHALVAALALGGLVLSADDDLLDKAKEILK